LLSSNHGVQHNNGRNRSNISRGDLEKSERETPKIHVLRTPGKRQKASAPSIPKPDSSPSKDIFSSKKHSMNYVTVDGVKLRTGYDDKKDWYLLCIKELLDNPVDFYWQKYRGASDAAIDVYIEKTSDSLLHIKVKNTNPKNIEAFTLEKLNLIFDFDMTAGSKQNLHIISRGVLGDALKQILALPYVLIHAHDDGTTFANRQWEQPLIIRSNGKEFHVPLYVDLANQTIRSVPIEEIDRDVFSTDTELEITLPIVDEIRDRLNIPEIEQYCREYPIFTTDISFSFKLVDNSSEVETNSSKNVCYSTSKKEQISGAAKTLTGPARNTTIKIHYPALHPIAEKWNNKASIHSYKPGEFTTFIEGVHDKINTTVYERIQQLREGTNMKMTPDLEASIADLAADTRNKDKREEKVFWQLRALLSAPGKLSLPYAAGEQRKAALVKRITRLYDGRLNNRASVYKTVDGFYKNDIVAYPFVFEIIAIPYSNESIIINEDWVKNDFKGSVNYSVSPRGNTFESDYQWEDPKKTTEFSSLRADTVLGILGVYNFYFYKHSDARTKLPCVIFANLVTPRADYHGADKSRIDATPFTEAIIKACRRVADNIPTFKAAGYKFETKYSRSFTHVREKTKTVDVIIEELLRTWM
jgi:hypothetical protein